VSAAGANLIYDEEKGIISAQQDEKKDAAAPRKPRRPTSPNAEPSRNKYNLHPDREPDPPDAYFFSGLQFYSDSNYQAALENFTHAASLHDAGRYQLWIGKTQRSLGNDSIMLARMRLILETWPDCEVADDALFEMAWYYQQQQNYARAQELYIRLIEEYPFGRAFSSNQRFSDFAKKQLARMHGKTAAMLYALGYDTAMAFSTMVEKAQQNMGLEPHGRLDAHTMRTFSERYLAQIDTADSSQTEAGGYSTATLIFILVPVAGVNLILLLVQLVLIKRKINRVTTCDYILAESDSHSV
jgi:tetratricopeptide (TPR) repeat protein